MGPAAIPLAKTMLGVGPVTSLPVPIPIPKPGPPVVAHAIPATSQPDPVLELQRDPVLPASVGDPMTGEAISPDEKRSLTPVDLPKVGTQKPLPLPAAKEEVEHLDSFLERLLTSARSVLELVNWSMGIYYRFPLKLFFLAAMVVLPVSFTNSCVRVGVSALVAPTIDPGVALVDFSARRAELAQRIARSQAAGQVDQQAIAELTALASVMTQFDASARIPDSGTGWFVQIVLAIIAGLLLSGFAYPIALGVLALAAADRQSGYSIPKPTDVLGILARRGGLLMSALLPAAILTAFGYVLFVIPGLVLSIVFVFVPMVVLFERQARFAALKRSVQLIKMDLPRIAILLLAFALSVFVFSLFIALFSGPTDSRALAFSRSILGDALVTAVLPIPSMALARIYLDLRKREGDSVGEVAQGARE
jgi:hypothetical protein